MAPEYEFFPQSPSTYLHIDDEITDSPSVVDNEYGSGRSVFVPWGIGAQYYSKGHHIHRAFFAAALRNVLGVEHSVETDAPHLVEISHLINRNGAFEWVGLINHAGQIGPTLGDAVPIYDTTIRLKPSSPARELLLMRSARSVDFRTDNDGWIEVQIPELRDFEMVVCLY